MKSLILSIFALVTFQGQAMVYKYECTPSTQQIIDAGVGSGVFIKLIHLSLIFPLVPILNLFLK